ncbi:monooxygenase [Achaetomium macrosporum]|uniref:Monooxygenase n=1 Tax=Achaetomium macrosporum TaxID=79813 RepID=A0AAN7HD81_9PEZI|nr:monooxygenase [Achaetomium macrosporum]
MSPATSSNDPILSLYHIQVDRLWWLWRQQDPSVRNTAIGGPRTQAKDSREATPEDVIPFLGLVQDVKVSELMTTQSWRLCLLARRN